MHCYMNNVCYVICICSLSNKSPDSYLEYRIRLTCEVSIAQTFAFEPSSSDKIKCHYFLFFTH